MAIVQLSINNQKIKDFLGAVDKTIIQIGVREYIDLISVLKSRNHWSAPELRATVSAILSTNSNQYRQIGFIFDKYILNHEQNKEPVFSPHRNNENEHVEQINEGESDQFFLYKIFGDFFKNNLRASIIISITSVTLFFLIIFVCGSIAIVNFSPSIEKPKIINSIKKIVDTISPSTKKQSTKNDEQISSFQEIVRSFQKIVIKPKPVKPKPVSQKKQPNNPKDNTKQPKFVTSRILVETSKQIILHNNIDRQSFRRDLISDDWYTLIFFWLLTTISFRCWKLGKKSRLKESLRKRKKLMKAALDKGDKVYRTYNVPLYKPISESTLDDAAFFFGRLYRQERGRELDIPSTMKKTVNNAGMFNPHFKPGKEVRELLVLIDVERGDYPWLSGFDRSLDYLIKQGVKIIKYRFQYTPSWLISDQGGTALTLKELHTKFSDDILLIFSRNLLVKDQNNYADFINDLKYWKIKALIDPEPKRYGAEYQQKGLHMFEKIGLKSFPLTNEGIIHLAVYLSSGDHSKLAVPWPICFPVERKKIQKALESWAVLASIVPDANWDQLEAIRRNPDFPEVSSVLTEPWHIQLLLDWISIITKTEPISGDGRTLAIDMETVDQLIRKQRQVDRNNMFRNSLEKRMHQLLLNQLESDPPDNEMSQYFWKLKIAEHKMILEPDQAEKLMIAFVGSPVEIEASQILKTELKRQDDGYILDNKGIPSSMKRKLQVLTGNKDDVEVLSLFRGDVLRSWITAMAASIVLTLMLGLAILISGYANYPWDIVQRDQSSELKVIFPNTYKVIQKISNN